MKRKLARASAADRRRERDAKEEAALDADAQQDRAQQRAEARKARKMLEEANDDADNAIQEVELSSEEDSESETEENAMEDESDAQDEEDDGEEGEEATPKKAKKAKGAMSKQDEKILKKRIAEQKKIANIVPYTNKQRVLIFCSRGINSRFRHLMDDMRSLLPHHRTEIKHDTKRNLTEINEVCEFKGCNNCMFFEARKRKDLYLWLCKTPNGPSVKFHVLNIHTMDELRLSGNCLKGSRPMLSFSGEFDMDPTLQLIKEIFTQIYGTPAGHPKSKPFVDHIMNFSLLDGKIWFRHFQIVDTTQDPKEIKRALKDGEETIKLVEIGPRFVLDLIKVFDGSFGGRTLVENPAYTTPTAERSAYMKGLGSKYASRKKSQQERAERAEVNVIPADPVRDVFRS